MIDMDYNHLKSLICRVESGSKTGTAFLINEKYAITAYHVLNKIENILLYFDSEIEPIKANYIDDTTNEYKRKDIALLELGTIVSRDKYLNFLSRKLEPKELWTSRGYPKTKGVLGNNFLGEDHIIQQHLDVLKNGKYDIELEHSKKLDSYEGVSGAPLIVNKLIAGVINSELTEQDTSKELTALSTQHFKELLNEYGIIIIEKDLLHSTKEDCAGVQRWGETSPTEKRNLAEKIKSVCATIKDYRINKYAREASDAKVELSYHSDRTVSALKYRIFDVCQSELMDLVDSSDSLDFTYEEIEDIINRYTDKAEEVVKERSKDYSYSGISNRDTLRKIVLDLIDECYLAFDEEGIYNEQ